MRFYEAIEITGCEAAYLIETNRCRGSRASVVSCDAAWCDVRLLSQKELESFIDEPVAGAAGVLPRTRLSGQRAAVYETQ
jgi:hypothetical protein